jgi:lipopolysaccharide export LptBFGC system permease protein LptF
MRILHRALFGELLKNAAATFAVVIALIFLGALSLQIGKASYDDLPMTAILKSVFLFVVHTLNLTLPMAVLATCLLTYGRIAAEGEAAAARTSGVHPWHLLTPALLLGAAVSCGLAALQDRVMPEAHYKTKFIADAVFTDIERVLTGAENRLRGGSFTAQWKGRSRDVDGRLVLNDLYLVRYRDGAPYEFVTAAKAKPSLAADDDRLILELFDVRRTEAGREGVAGVGYQYVPIDLDSLAARRRVRRKPVQMSGVELWSVAATEGASETGRRASAEIHYRIALAASAILFALFGAPLGLKLRLANRGFVFLVGALVVLLGYWPLTAVGKRLAESGALPPYLALNAANVALLVFGLRLSRAAVRS